MNIVKNFVFHDQSMMVGSIVIGNINNIYSKSKQTQEETLEEADFEVVDVEDSVAEAPPSPVFIPEELNTPIVIDWLGKLQRVGWLDENYQPVKLTVAQMGCIVVKAQYELRLKACWKDFATLWNMKKDTLRMGFMSGQDTKQTKAFNKKLNEI